MKSGLEQAYELVVEGAKEGTVKTNLKPGQAAAGEVKKDKGTGPENTGVKKPTEGEAKINPGHGKIKTESRELSDMLPTSKFDSLFKKQVIEEEGEFGADESPLEMGGEGEFSDDQGDFPPAEGDETAEEIDVATEIRMIIDRLTEVAERLGAYDEDMDEAGEEVGQAGAEGEEIPKLAPESVQAKMKPMKDATKTMQAKKNVVKSAFKASGKKASATGGPGKGAADGKLGPARKT
ncbi:MAG: hypothetical protein ABFD50_15375, partial [Smithella sp.]